LQQQQAGRQLRGALLGLACALLRGRGPGCLAGRLFARFGQLAAQGFKLLAEFAVLLLSPAAGSSPVAAPQASKLPSGRRQLQVHHLVSHGLHSRLRKALLRGEVCRGLGCQLFCCPLDQPEVLLCLGQLLQWRQRRCARASCHAGLPLYACCYGWLCALWMMLCRGCMGAKLAHLLSGSLQLQTQLLPLLQELGCLLVSQVNEVVRARSGYC
jgi:hypothetical protein